MHVNVHEAVAETRAFGHAVQVLAVDAVDTAAWRMCLGYTDGFIATRSRK